MPKALAFSNNDIAVFAWSYEQKLAGCLGFAVYRGDVHAGTWEPLPALARFDATSADTKETTEQAPVQKYLVEGPRRPPRRDVPLQDRADGR